MARIATISAAAAVVLGLTVTRVSAQMVYEPFDYGSGAVGQAFANQTGSPTWSGYVVPSSGQQWFTSATTVSGTTNSVDDLIKSGNLTAPTGLASSIGNSIGNPLNSGGTAGNPDVHVVNMAMTPTSFSGTGTTVYNSVVFTVNDLTPMGTGAGGVFVYGMTNSSFAGTQGGTPGNLASSLQVRRDQTNNSLFNVGLRYGTSTVWDTTAFTPGSPVFLVFGYQFTTATPSASANDVQAIWINPDPSTFGQGTAPTPSITRTGNAINLPLKSLFINRGANNSLSPNALQFDEIRVDTTWAQVTPPSGSTFNAATSTDWSNAGTWATGGVPNGAAKFAYLTGSAGGTVNVDSAQVVGTLTFRGPGAYSVSSNNSSGITLNGGAGGASAINVQATMDAATADTPVATAHAISVPLTLANNLSVNVAQSQTLTVSGSIGDSTGTATLTKNGPGTLILQGSNAYGGMTTVNSGVLAVNGDAALGAVPAGPALNLVLVKGTGTTGTLRFDADASLAANRTIELMQNGGGGPTINTNGHNVTIAGQMTAGAGGSNLVKMGVGTLTLTADNSQTLLAGGGAVNALTINGGAINASQDVNLGKIGSTVTLNGGALQYGAGFNPTGRQVSIGSGSGVVDTNGFDSTIDGAISNSGANVTGTLTKAGGGTLTLAGANTMNGALRVTGGVLALSGPSAWGPVFSSTPGGAVINAGKLVFNYAGTSAPDVRTPLTGSHAASNFTDANQRIRTSNANDANHGIGYIDDVASSKVTLMYTWYGDVNLDGVVNADDYALLDKGAAQYAANTIAPNAAVWVNGDFNYDGQVTSADYLLIDTSFGIGHGGALSPDLLAERQAQFGDAYVSQLIAAVPEPTSLGFLGLAAGALLGRRRGK